MSIIQKYSIKKINKIRKLLLLYIDKDLKNHYKRKKRRDSIIEKFEHNNVIYQKSYSNPIFIEENFSNLPEEKNSSFPLIQLNSISFDTKTSFNYNYNNDNISYSFKSAFSSNSKEKTMFPAFQKKEKYISKLEKHYIIIKDDKLRLRKKIDSMSYLFNLYKNFKFVNRRKKCLSSVKIKSKNNKKDGKETILDVKKKQKRKNIKDKSDGKASVLCNKKNISVQSIDINELNVNIKKSKKRSLFFQKNKFLYEK
jgi:hypothetical protein